MAALIVLVGIALLGGFLVMTRFSGELHERSQVKKAPRVTVVGAQPGKAVRLVGVVRLAEPLRSPLSGKQCAWYRVTVTRGPVVLDLTDARDFALEDDTGRAEIEATSALSFVTAPRYLGASDVLPPEALAFLEKHQVEKPVVATARTIVIERVLEVDRQAVVYGFVDVESGTGGSYREAAQKVVVRQAMRITDDLSLA